MFSTTIFSLPMVIMTTMLDDADDALLYLGGSIS
jgi:hypothetical protein